ncbi:PHP domain-containing protein [Marispirochaeta sp.]|uniref:PHP domain-containing protein n=1 Tax=Marispirochaeta sp. TaxID=2038653 RepID=UPI0029C92404|nr:PHP domain-containing protein [Marispirochaeta sp.]
MIDLHLHSTASDGRLSPSGLILKAAEYPGSITALTDHDTLSGLPEFTAAAEQHGVTALSGVELSADFPHGELHLLGYNFDSESLEAVGLLSRIRSAREERNRGVFHRMETDGLPVDYHEWRKTIPGPSPGRPHIADYFVTKGIARSRREAFDRFLSEGRPYYLPRKNPPLKECVDAILSAGGIPVVAHPWSLRISFGTLVELIPQWREIGIMGLETIHPSVNRDQSRRLSILAEKNGFLCSGGSDYHGTPEDKRFFGKTSWGAKIPADISILVYLGLRQP